MLRKKIIFLFFFFHFLIAYSGNYDSLYVRVFPYDFTLRCGISSKDVSIILTPVNKADTLHASPIIYKPNINSYFYVGGSWKFLGGSISFKIPKTDEDTRLRGSSEYFDFRFGLTKKRFATSVYLKQYQGFFIERPQTIYPQWQSGQAYPRRSDIIYSSIGLEGYYVFNWKKYSIRAALNQSDKQLKHSGSFMLKADYSYIGIQSDSALIPSTQADFYPEMKGLRSCGFLSGVISAGYAYVFTIGKNWFVSPFLFTGFGYQARGFYVDENFIKKNNLFAFTDFKLNGGFNGTRFFYTFNFDVENYFMNEKEIKLQTSGALFYLNIGFRF